MAEITIIMPFLNERDEPIITARNILQTAPHHLLKIIAINDGGEDLPIYRELAAMPRVVYVHHVSSKGVAYCRTTYSEWADTPYIMLIDGHMRFKDDGWLERILSNLRSHPQNTLFCTRTITLTEDDKDVYGEGHVVAGGARIVYDLDKPEILYPVWIPPGSQRSARTELVPCVLGANYCVSTSWFREIHGVQGLMEYGCDEEFMSLKSWIMGGSAMVMNDVEIAHIFRINRNGSQVTVPYVKRMPEYMLYNRLYMIHVLFPEPTRDEVYAYIEKTRPGPFATVSEQLAHYRYYNDAERAYVQSRSVTSIHDVFRRIGVYA
jgi:glycosyltransferase involved in cell wall biosynthesis